MFADTFEQAGNFRVACIGSERWAVKGDEAEPRSASDDFGCHCLTVTGEMMI
jgi:hypothetical protein